MLGLKLSYWTILVSTYSENEILRQTGPGDGGPPAHLLKHRTKTSRGPDEGSRGTSKGAMGPRGSPTDTHGGPWGSVSQETARS